MIDVQAIGPENSEVGFATINGAFHNKFGFSEMFYKVSKYAGYIPFLLVAFTGLMGLKELIEKRVYQKLIVLFMDFVDFMYYLQLYM